MSEMIEEWGVEEHATLPIRLAGLGISGGAVYDALVTLDRRALATYQRCRIPARLLA